MLLRIASNINGCLSLTFFSVNISEQVFIKKNMDKLQTSVTYNKNDLTFSFKGATNLHGPKTEHPENEFLFLANFKFFNCFEQICLLKNKAPLRPTFPHKQLPPQLISEWASARVVTGPARKLTPSHPSAEQTGKFSSQTDRKSGESGRGPINKRSLYPRRYRHHKF